MAFCAFTVTSCGFFCDDETQKDVEVKQIVELSDTVKQHLIKQDSLYSDLIAKIDTLTIELNASQQNVAKLQKDKLESPESFWNYMTVGAIILAVFAIILIFLRGSGLNKSGVDRMVRDYLDNSMRLNDLQRRIHDLEKMINSSPKYMPTGSVPKTAEGRIIYLEGKIKEVIEAVNRHEKEFKNLGGAKTMPPSTLPTPPIPQQPKFSKEGYAELNSGKIFIKVLESNQEGCVYHIQFLSDTKGLFDLISLDKIKSCNGWKEVVDVTGDCTMADAKKYDVVSKGTCIKTLEGYWKVQENLKIKISK